MAAPDVPILNYALMFERLEHAFYRDGLAEFGEDELMNADVLSSFGQQIRIEVPEYLDTLRTRRPTSRRATPPSSTSSTAICPTRRGSTRSSKSPAGSSPAVGLNAVVMAVWGQNYRELRTKHTLGLLVFATLLFHVLELLGIAAITWTTLD